MEQLINTVIGLAPLLGAIFTVVLVAIAYRRIWETKPTITISKYTQNALDLKITTRHQRVVSDIKVYYKNRCIWQEINDPAPMHYAHDGKQHLIVERIEFKNILQPGRYKIIVDLDRGRIKKTYTIESE